MTNKPGSRFARDLRRILLAAVLFGTITYAAKCYRQWSSLISQVVKRYTSRVRHTPPQNNIPVFSPAEFDPVVSNPEDPKRVVILIILCLIYVIIYSY